MNILRLERAEFSIGTHKLLEGASLTLDAGEKVALIGRNGAGKSTLLTILAGQAQLDDGILWRADNLRVSVLNQTQTEGDDELVYHVVVGGLGGLGHLLERYHETASQPAPDLNVLAGLEADIEAHGGWNVEQRVQTVLSDLQLPGEAKLGDLSGGWRRRAGGRHRHERCCNGCR